MAESWEDLDLEEVEESKNVASNAQNEKDTWEDFEEEEEDAQKEENKSGKSSKVSSAGSKKKRTVAQAIKERQEAEERKRKEALEKMKQTNLESEYERKMRIENEVIEKDLENAKDLFGDAPEKGNEPVMKTKKGIDEFVPKTKEDFDTLSKMISEKLAPYQSTKLYSSFLDSLIRELVSNVNYSEIRQLSSMLNALSNEKQKQATSKGKKKSANKKASIKTEHSEMESFEPSYDRDDYDDFI